MAPETVVHATQAWLQASWHVHVPFAWLEACVEWLQEEAGGEGRLSQQQINQQALDQWLLTDLRDLDYPVLPEGLAQAQKTELRGTFCVQVDSLLDISQPAYGQLQKWRGTDCTNDEVSSITQNTQRPWEARPTRMLLLQVTDGVQSLEAMEYQPIPALSPALRPGVKLQLLGQMVCRLGVILLGPANIKVLGGEVEDLVDRNNQGKVLCRTLGVPEEEQQQPGGEEAPPSHQGNEDIEDLGLDDQELLASLEVQEEVEMVPVRPVQDSDYGTLISTQTSTQSLRSSSVRSLISNASSRSEASAHSHRSGLTQNSRRGSVQGHRHSNGNEDSDLTHPSSSDRIIQQDITDHDTAEEDFPEEDFDDLPLDELDSVIFLESTNVTAQSNGGHTSTQQNNNNRIPKTPNRTTNLQQPPLYGTASQRSNSLANNESEFMDEDMDCFVEEGEDNGVQTGRSGEPGPRRGSNFASYKTSESSLKPACKLSKNAFSEKDPSFESSHSAPQGQSHTSSTAEFNQKAAEFNQKAAKSAPQSDITLTSPPFTYLCLLEELNSKPYPCTMQIHVKAFIVTLLGKLSSSGGLWRVSATISDGTGYLDVELSDEVLTGLLGFSVAEKGALKRDPKRRGELDDGMKRCQEELVDMCCVMTIELESESRKAVVTKVDPVNEQVHRELEQRVRDRRK
ncbi:recQ-mediated genome instability protein 1 [Aulostomus maculatus]